MTAVDIGLHATECCHSINPATAKTESPYLTERRWRPLLHGVLLILFGLWLYLTTVVLAVAGGLIKGNPLELVPACDAMV